MALSLVMVIAIFAIAIIYGKPKPKIQYPGTGAFVANEETQKIVDEYRGQHPSLDTVPCPFDKIDTDGNCLDSK